VWINRQGRALSIVPEEKFARRNAMRILDREKKCRMGFISSIIVNSSIPQHRSITAKDETSCRLDKRESPRFTIAFRVEDTAPETILTAAIQ
jgi:hypothetical protein